MMAERVPGYYEEVAHTADVCLRVRAQTLEALYVTAAQGMFALMRWRPTGPERPMRESLRLEAADWETLLVDWLSELLYLAEQHGARWVTFDLALTAPVALAAHVEGVTGWLPERIVKAVTYHGLRLHQTDDGSWETFITFDV
ncbi:MAG: archease [Chloroflexi bacterium]|nr:archease [Chloroflexota bacterium]